MKSRFLHIADVHLDTTFAGRPDHRARLQEAQRTAFQRAIDCALEEQVDAVLIAGDLFDNHRLTLGTEHFLIRQLARLHEAGVPCVYVTGNHDPGGSRYRSGGLAWPGSFHFIKGKRPEQIDIADRDGRPLLRVVGAGHIDERVADNLAGGFPSADGPVPHVGLLHTMVGTAGGAAHHDRYAPCSVDDLQRPGYAYWALGHIHLRQQVCDKSNAWYPGNLVGRNPRETGAKGGLLVTLDGRGVHSVQFRAFAPVQWLDVSLDALGSITTTQALEEEVRRLVRKEQAGHPDVSDWFVRLRLSGPSPLAHQLRDGSQLEDIEAAFADSLGITHLEIRSRNITLPVDLNEHRGQPHVLGEVLELLEELKENDPDLLESVAADRFAGGEGEEYVRQLLDGLDRLAAERLLIDAS